MEINLRGKSGTSRNKHVKLLNKRAVSKTQGRTCIKSHTNSSRSFQDAVLVPYKLDSQIFTNFLLLSLNYTFLNQNPMFKPYKSLKNSKMIYLDQNLACKLVLQHFFFFLSFLMTFWISMYLSKSNSFEKQTMTRSRMCNKYLTWKRRVLTQKSHTINKEIIVWISYVGPKRNFTNINISLVTDFNMKFWKTVQNRSRIKSLIKKQLI